MSGFAPLYGRIGPKAGGDPYVAELLTRTTENQFRATSAFDAAVAQLTPGVTHPWPISVSSLTVLHSQWLSMTLWQAATSYLDGVVMAYWNDGHLPEPVYRECDALCDLAASMTMQAIQLQSELDAGGKLTLAAEQPFPKLNGGGPGYGGVWYALETICNQVSSDMQLLESYNLPRPFQAIWQSIKTAYAPQANVFAYLQTSWNTTVSTENRMQVVRDAWPVAQKLFSIGQSLWAPYLLGRSYTEARNYKPSLEELELSFDPWILTDATEAAARSGDKASREELRDFWLSVTDPAAVKQLADQLAQAHQDHRVRVRTGNSYGLVPWPSQYLVRFPTQFGTRQLQAGDLAAYFSSEDEQGRSVDIRRTGHLTSVYDLLGQPRK